MSKMYVKRETVDVPHWSNKVTVLHRWAVRLSDTHLVGYSSTWTGAWRMVYESFGERYPSA